MQYTVKHVFTAAAMIFIMLAVALAPALISPAEDIAYGKKVLTVTSNGKYTARTSGRPAVFCRRK